MIREEVLCKERMFIELMNESSFKELIEASQKRDEIKDKKRLQGVNNYDILNNHFYAERYLYPNVRLPNRNSFVISQYEEEELQKSALDLVRIVCDFAYLDE